MASQHRAKDGGTAAALRRLARDHRERRLTLGAVIAALGGEGFGLLVLALTLPNLIPAPPIPGFSLPFALAIAALGLQMAMGFERPLLPRRLLRWSMDFTRFRRFVDRAEPHLLTFERLIGPRPCWLTAASGNRLVGTAILLLSPVLALPLPLGNTPINLSLVIISLGLLEEDGRALAWGLAAGALALVWNAGLILAGAEIFELLRLHFG